MAHLGDQHLDESEERRRLAHAYSKMTDGELLNLAQESESLTESAQEILDEELDRRDLQDWAEEKALESESGPRPEKRELVMVRQFRDLPEALLAKGSLESAGIECFLADENLVRLDWFISNFIGGIKLRVAPSDLETALRLLNEPILEGLYVHGVGLYEQPRCPKCQSLDVCLQEVERTAWHCESCHAEWEDDGFAEETEARP